MSRHQELALFAFVDALGWRIFQEHALLEGRLQTAAPVESILGYSCACDPTILSGELPSTHGHFSFFQYAPERSPFSACRWLRFLPQWITRRGRVRRQISKLLQWWHGFTGYFQIYNVPFDKLPLFDYSEKRDIYQPGGLNAGTPTIFDELRARRIPFGLSDWRRNEEQNLAQMRDWVDAGEIRFGYLYLAELDGIMHASGTRAPQVSEKIAWYDRQFRTLLDAAERRYDAVRLYVFSDHGMTDVHTNVDLIGEIERLGWKFGTDYAAMYDSTMARFWFLNPAAERSICGALEQHAQGRLLRDEELRRWGAFFPDRRYGEQMFLLNPGGLITPSYMNHAHVPGMHGYDPADDDSVAVLLSTAKVTPPKRLDGLYGLMQAELELCGETEELCGETGEQAKEAERMTLGDA